LKAAYQTPSQRTSLPGCQEQQTIRSTLHQGNPAQHLSVQPSLLLGLLRRCL